MNITQIRKRNGQVADFDKDRIRNAIAKAAESAQAQVDADVITDQVVSALEKLYTENSTDIPNVEKIQDIVERILVEIGHFEIAKRYILYRAEHERIRAEKRVEELQKIESNALRVVNSEGREEIFDISRVEQIVNRIAQNYPSVDVKMILEELKQNIYEGIKTDEIATALVMVGKSYIERDPEYSFFTSQLLLEKIYKEVFQSNHSHDDFNIRYRKSFRENLERGKNVGRINEELLAYDFNAIEAALQPERDKILTFLGLQTLYDRYFIHIKGQHIEAPQHFWMRVSMGLALAEPVEQRTQRALQFYEVLSTLRFVSSTPTLFNSGTCFSQLSSCYLSTVSDSLDHIFKVIGDNAQLSKWAGGIGNDWTNIRATGAQIHGTNGQSQGVVPFLKIVNDTAVAVNQGGKRKGAVVSYLECWHYDVEEFLDLRKNTGDDRRRTHDMNTANWIPDLFIKRVQEEGEWTLFSPDEVPELHDLYGKAFEAKYMEYEQLAREGKIHVHKTIEAAKLWRKMVTMLFETGHPWITYKDPCNVRSPQDHVGVVHNSNLCTEITLNNSNGETAVCNLGSINMARHFNHEMGEVDWDLLQNTIETAMRMLDNVIDINLYPTPETKTSNMKHRPVGLGMMGLQDLLYLKNLPFDCQEAVNVSDQVMEFISYHAIMGSSRLAAERGAYETFPGSKWDRGLFPIDTLDLLEQERGQAIEVNRDSRMDWTPVREHVKTHGMRNSNTMAIAPTATISNIAGCIPCIEPIYKNLYVKSNMGGEFTVINHYLVDRLKDMGMWNEETISRLKASDGSIRDFEDLPEELKAVFKEVFDVTGTWIIQHAAVRGKWIDQAQSTNIFYRGTSGKEIADIYLEAWKRGLKTTYYLRTLGATQVQKSTVSYKQQNISRFPASDKTKGVDSTTPTAETPTATPEKKAEYSAEAAAVCSILNGPNCEACQ